jgi:sulfur-oxidizing protein SoxA
MVRTIVLDINECLKRKGKEPIKDLKQGTMAQVVAYMKSLSRGQRIRLNISSPGAIEAYEEGQRFYWARRGRYAGCNSQVRAAPFKPQSRQYRHLEFYETYMQTGLPLTAPSQRF